MRVSDAFGSDAMKKQSGIRTSSAEVTPCAMTGRLFPRPLKYPMTLKSTQVSTHSGEKPLRNAALCAITPRRS